MKENTKEVVCEILSDHFIGMRTRGQKKERYLTIKLDGKVATVPITAKMEKEVYNTSKVKLTIEIV